MAEVVRFSSEDEERARVDTAFSMVADILTKVREPGAGMDLNHELAEMAGSPDFYNALIAGSEAFIHEHPRIQEGRAPAPHVMALWIGLVVGARAAQET
jgi:hypothetical protein